MRTDKSSYPISTGIFHKKKRRMASRCVIAPITRGDRAGGKRRDLIPRDL